MKPLLLAIVLVMSPASASAECAWVLWKDTLDTAPKVLWQQREITPLGGHPSQAECEYVSKRLMEEHPHLTTGEQPGAGTVLHQISFVCLPDTVDPRGPKGK